MWYPILDTRISFVRPSSVTLRVPPLTLPRGQFFHPALWVCHICFHSVTSSVALADLISSHVLPLTFSGATPISLNYIILYCLDQWPFLL